jgi:hypothetical protein
MKKTEMVAIIIYIFFLSLAVYCQGINIVELQEKVDYLSDELLTTNGVLHSISYDLDYHIEKCGVQE